jgi:hypothetical protein
MAALSGRCLLTRICGGLCADEDGMWCALANILRNASLTRSFSIAGKAWPMIPRSKLLPSRAETTSRRSRARFTIWPAFSRIAFLVTRTAGLMPTGITRQGRAIRPGEERRRNLGHTIRNVQAGQRSPKKPPQSEGCRWYESWLSDSPVLSAGEINGLPEKLRRYIHDLETRSDPAGDIKEIASLTNNEMRSS